MQMVYYAMNDKKLFDDEMYAYDNGVVVDTVMSNYRYLVNNKKTYSINDFSIKEYIKKMYNILKYAPLEELINISHQDKEWKKHTTIIRKKIN